jgi:H+-transporting ATPase
MIIINETIRADLVVFIALFADLATVAVAYDVSFSWNLWLKRILTVL